MGFATKFLDLEPSVTLLRNPVVVAGVVGFWEARGLAPMTIKLRVQHIRETSSFVATRFCPKSAAYRPDTAEEAILINAWFKRLSAKVTAEAERQPKKLYNVELWEAWDFATREWVAFIRELQVGASFSHMALGYNRPRTHFICDCRPITTDTPLSWPGSARQLC